MPDSQTSNTSNTVAIPDKRRINVNRPLTVFLLAAVGPYSSGVKADILDSLLRKRKVDSSILSLTTGDRGRVFLPLIRRPDKRPILQAGSEDL